MDVALNQGPIAWLVSEFPADHVVACVQSVSQIQSNATDKCITVVFEPSVDSFNPTPGQCDVIEARIRCNHTGCGIGNLRNIESKRVTGEEVPSRLN